MRRKTERTGNKFSGPDLLVQAAGKGEEIPGKQAMHIRKAVIHKICASINGKCKGILAFASIYTL